MTNTKSELLHEETKERIPIQDLGLLRVNPNEQESLINVRLKANDLKWRIFRQLCGYVDEEDAQGNIFLVPSRHLKGMISIQAALKITRTIEFMINSNIRLGYVRDEEALHEYKECVCRLAVSLVLDPDWEDIPVYVKDEIMSLVAPNAWHSLSGAIGGKEARAIVTTITEQKGEMKSHEKFEGSKKSLFTTPSFGGEQ